MRIVITYQHKGDEKYLELIKLAFASAKRLGYETVLVGNVDLGDYKINFPAENEPYLMNWVLAAQKAFIDSPLFDCDSVIFSPDALILRPLEAIFNRKFDIGFTIRDNKRWPINNGVIYLQPLNKRRISDYWSDCIDLCKAYPVDTQQWYGDQLAVYDAWVAGNHLRLRLSVAMLACELYNASPVDIEEIDDNILKNSVYYSSKGQAKSYDAEILGYNMQRLIQINGDWWPETDTECRPSVMDSYKDADLAIELCAKTEVVIQAGGNCGIWPRYLAKKFETVYTFEPDADNFQCLVLNAPAKNIYKMQAALGDKSEVVSLARTPDNVGGHSISTKLSIRRPEIPTMTIDQLSLPACDLIQLDLEGYEYFALIGASKTIKRYKPVIMLEDKLHGRKYSIDDIAIPKLLDGYGYAAYKKIHRDVIWVPK